MKPGTVAGLKVKTFHLAGAPSVAGEGPLRVLRQRDVGGGSLARAATTAIPTAIARESQPCGVGERIALPYG